MSAIPSIPALDVNSLARGDVRGELLERADVLKSTALDPRIRNLRACSIATQKTRCSFYYFTALHSQQALKLCFFAVETPCVYVTAIFCFQGLPEFKYSSRRSLFVPTNMSGQRGPSFLTSDYQRPQAFSSESSLTRLKQIMKTLAPL